MELSLVKPTLNPERAIQELSGNIITFDNFHYKVNEIPDDMLVKLAYLKIESLLSLFMMISIEAQLYAEGKNLKDLKI